MAMDFSGSAGAASSFDTIPNGQLAYANLNVRGVKASASGGGYLDCELVIAEGQPYAGRKLWDMIGDPQNGGNSEAYRQMGTIAITRILEAGRGAGPNNMAGYAINSYTDLTGLRVAIKIGVEAGKDGHADRNRVTEYLTPNPASQSGHKFFVKLQAGEFNATAAPAQAANGFGAAAAPAVFAGFGGAAPAQAAAPVAGFQQAQSGFAASPAAPTQPTPDVAASATLASSPSSPDPSATPGWLAQATPQ